MKRRRLSMKQASNLVNKKKGIALRIFLLILFIILFIIIMLPFYAITLASFKPGEDLIRYGLNLKFDF